MILGMKKLVVIIIIIVALTAFFHFRGNGDEEYAENGSGALKTVSIDYDGLILNDISAQNQTVGEFLESQKFNVSGDDFILPERDAGLISGERIIIQKAKNLEIKSDGERKEVKTFGKNIATVLGEQDINLSEDDIVQPGLYTPIVDGDLISIVRVIIKEEVIKEEIKFQTIENEDDKLGWREKKVTQKGENGTKEIKYKVAYHDGKEVSRKILETNVTKEPVKEVITQGTYVKIGKTHTGMASWYSYTGTMSAANPWLPMGSYVRVTNTENGKSVIVKINDRGPFGNGRIIDLDKVAFAKIANLGAGVANVKMEVIIN
jgi:uncharacterized protein YabE (DUF348 family)